MATPAHPPDDPRPADPGGTDAELAFTVQELQRQLAEQLPTAEELIEQIFADWPGTTPCGPDWLAQVNAQWESIRQRVVRGATDHNLKQADFHLVTDVLGERLGPRVACEIRPLPWELRLARLNGRLRFALRRNEAELVDHLAGIRPEHVVARLQARAADVRGLEHRLHLAGCLSGYLPDQAVFPFVMEAQYLHPERAFGRALARLRKAKGLTLRELGRRVDTRPQDLHHFEKCRHLPGIESSALVARLVAVLGAPELMAAYWVSRDFQNVQNARCLRRDVRQKDFVTAAHQAQFDAWLVFENTRTGVSRRGKKNSGGPLARGTRRTYFGIFAGVLTCLQLPATAENPRLRGLGLAAGDVSLLDLGHLPFLAAHFARQQLRNGRTGFASVDSLALGKLRDLHSVGGYFWQNAARLAATMPAATRARLPEKWPEGSERPGAFCLNGAEQIRARCLGTWAALGPWQREAGRAAPSQKHLRCLVVILRQQAFPLDALMEILRRHHRKIPRTRAEAFQMMVLALLALNCWRPRRPEEFGLLRLGDVALEWAGPVSALSRPKKNGGSCRAQQQVFGALPPELAQYVRDYVEHARPLLFPGVPSDGDRLFCSRRGEPLSAQLVGVLLGELVADSAPDLFPMGLNPQAVRTIVATDLAMRFGLKPGTILAADALIDHASTTLHSYIVHQPDPAHLQPGEKSQEAAVAASYAKVFGHRFRPTPLKPL